LVDFETDDTDPVRFPISSSPSDRTQESLNKISAHNLFRRNIALVSQSLPETIIDQKLYLTAERTINPKELKEWIKDSKTHNSFPIAEIINDNSLKINEMIRQTKLREFSDALMNENCVWKGCRNLSESLQNFPQINKQAFISDISYAYNLNKLQHIAFKIIAKALLKKWLDRELYRI